MNTVQGKLRRQTALRNLTIAGNLFLCALALVIAVLLYMAGAKYAESTALSRLSMDWAHALDDTLALLNEAETNQRGYLLTGKETYLEMEQTARPDVEKRIALLHSLSTSDPQQKDNVAKLQDLAKKRLDELTKTIDIKNASGTEDAVAAVMTGNGKQAMDAVREHIELMKKQENSRWDALSASAGTSAKYYQGFAVLFAITTLVFFGVLALLLRKYTRLQRLVTVCAWSQRVQYKGKWIPFEEFLETEYNTMVSHGISEEEAAKLLMDESLRIEKKPEE